jgi:Cdc6-like AAA superfamily ATPase
MTLFQQRESRIIKDAVWLQPLSDPPGGKPLCRDKDLKIMASLLSDIFETGQGSNILLIGKPGTGKTTCVRYLLSEVQKHAERTGHPVVTVYVNAGKTRTPYYTMLEIAKELGFNVPRSGWQMCLLKRVCEEALEKTPTVIAIDEVEALLLKEKEQLVYYLNRQPKTTLILISNKIDEIAKIPDKALSTLQPKLLTLEPYTPEQAETILKERVEKALQSGAISNDVMKTLSKLASKAEDIRIGFSIITGAGRTAENQGKKTIETKDIAGAAKIETGIAQVKELLQRISEAKARRNKRR